MDQWRTARFTDQSVPHQTSPLFEEVRVQWQEDNCRWCTQGNAIQECTPAFGNQARDTRKTTLEVQYVYMLRWCPVVLD